MFPKVYNVDTVKPLAYMRFLRNPATVQLSYQKEYRPYMFILVLPSIYTYPYIVKPETSKSFYFMRLSRSNVRHSLGSFSVNVLPL